MANLGAGIDSKALVFRVELPPVECTPNRRVDRHTKARAIAEYRGSVRIDALDARNRARWSAPAKARVSLLFGMRKAPRGRARPFDADNAVAAFKAGLDGLCDAAVIADDDWASLELGRIAATFEAGPWVEITVEIAPA